MKVQERNTVLDLGPMKKTLVKVISTLGRNIVLIFHLTKAELDDHRHRKSHFSYKEGQGTLTSSQA